MVLNINVEIIDNQLGGYFLKSEEAIEVNNFKELCIYLEDMRTIYDANVMIEWLSKANQNINDLVEKDIKSRPDLFILNK